MPATIPEVAVITLLPGISWSVIRPYFRVPVTARMYSTSVELYGQPSGWKMSWNHTEGSSV